MKIRKYFIILKYNTVKKKVSKLERPLGDNSKPSRIYKTLCLLIPCSHLQQHFPKRDRPN